MILVFIVLGIIILLSFMFLVLILSAIKIEINKLHISNTSKSLKIDFILKVGVYAFNKIKTISIRIDNYKIKKALDSGKIDIEKIKNNKIENKEILKILKKINFSIEYVKLEGYYATFNTVLSSLIYSSICAVIPLIVAPKMYRGKYINNLKFLNINENIINININCIISVKIGNIINTLYYLKKKGGVSKNGKSSYRRSYAYSNG